MKAGILMAVCGLLLSAAGQAAATIEPEVALNGGDRLISGSTGTEDDPQVAWNAVANQYLVVWDDSRSEGTRGWEIYGRRVGADGVPVASDFLISTSIADEVNPQLVWNATANQYLVVWEDNRSAATRGAEIYGRRVGADGVPVGSDFRISNSTADEYAPAVAWNATANQYLVVWDDNRSAAHWEIFGRRVGADGALLGGNVRISRSTAETWNPDVAWNATANQYLVVWEDNRSAATRGLDIYGRRVSVDGALLGGNVRISKYATDELSPAVVWNATANQYLVVFQAEDPISGGERTFGRRVGADGVPLGGNLRISNSDGGTQELPQVAWNATVNQYLVVWHDGRNWATRKTEIYGRRVSVDGERLGADVRISNSATGEFRPAVAWNATVNQYLVVWADNRDYWTRGFEIYGGRRSVDGLPAP